MTRRIVLVSGTLEAGGAERDISGMANYWAAKGWRVTLATFSGPQIPDFYSLAPVVDRIWLDNGRLADSKLTMLAVIVERVRVLRRLLRALRPDAVLSYIDVPNVLTLLAASKLGLRVVVSERGSPELTPKHGLYPLAIHWRLLRRLLYRRAAAVTALNSATADWIARQCGVDVRVIPPALRPMPAATATRERFVLGIGRLHRVKGFDVMLNAFTAIQREFPGWRMILIGNGPEKSALSALATKLGLADRVEFMEPVRDIEEWMARAGLVVLPSRSEAFGNVALESMAMAAPVIATNCPGPASIIADGQNGRVVTVEDAAALAAAMRELLTDAGLRDRLGREATKVRDRYRQEVVMDAWEEILLPESAAP